MSFSFIHPETECGDSLTLLGPNANEHNGFANMMTESRSSDLAISEVVTTQDNSSHDARRMCSKVIKMHHYAQDPTHIRTHDGDMRDLDAKRVR